MVAVKYILDAVDRLPDPSSLIVFPGMEVTCKDDVQCLILFDPTSKPDDWNALFGSVITGLGGSGYDANAPKAPQVDHTGCGHPLNDLMKLIEENPSLRDRVLVFPNVGPVGKHKTALRRRLGYRLSDHNFLAGYAEHDFNKYTDAEKSMLSGQDRAWSRRRLPVLTTGDNRTSDGSKLACYPTWIKLGEPTLEGLRQAVLAPDARISYDEPSEPALVIESFTVSSALTGENFRVDFNSGYNALIGGRGSGKTSLLEYLRFGLGRALVDLDDVEISSERQKRLIEATLEEGKVQVKLSINGVKETWTREYVTQETITIKKGDGEVEISPEEARQRFDARSYAQKELSSLGEANQSVDRRITRLAAGDFTDLQKAAESDMEKSARDVKAALRDLLGHWRIEQELADERLALSDLDAQVLASQSELSEKGLSEQDQAILDRQPKMEAAKSAASELAAWEEEVNVEIDAASGAIFDPDESVWNRLEHAGVDIEAKAKVSGAVAEARMHIQKAKLAISSIKPELDATNQTLLSITQKHQSEFEGVSERAVANRTLIERIQRLQINRGGLLRSIADLEARYKASESSVSALETAQERHRFANQKFKGVLSDAASHVGTSSAGLLQAAVELPESPENLGDALSAFGKRANIRRLDEQVANLCSALNDQKSRSDFESKLLKLLKMKVMLGESPTLGPETVEELKSAFGFSSLSTTQANNVFANIDEESVGTALTESPIPFIRFRYKDGKNYIDFADASPGQQAAALLDLLLHQKMGPLIIDQPEEDLENARIMEIAKQLQSSKSDRQVIFATHNPNILVNGDADKIVALAGVGEIGKSERIAIEADGSIDSHTLQKIITERLEGGAEAFKLRAKKLNVE